MEEHSTYDDNEFERLFRNCQFPVEVFNHEAHLRLAWINLSRYGPEAAVRNITTQLKVYVTFLGAEEKYHETLTIASIKAVWHFMLKSDFDNFKDFITEYPCLKYNFKELIFQHYSTDIFTSENARKKFLEPELLAFD